MINLLRDKKFKNLTRVIALALIVSFLAYDIAWAHPDTFSYNSTQQDNKLAIQSLFKDKESIDRVTAKYVETLLEKGLNPYNIRLDIIKNRLDDLKEKHEGWIRNNLIYTVSNRQILISISPGCILRYYDPNIAGDDARYVSSNKDLASSIRINRELSKQLLVAKALPSTTASGKRQAGILTDLGTLKTILAFIVVALAGAIGYATYGLPGLYTGAITLILGSAIYYFHRGEDTVWESEPYAVTYKNRIQVPGLNHLSWIPHNMQIGLRVCCNGSGFRYLQLITPVHLETASENEKELPFDSDGRNIRRVAYGHIHACVLDAFGRIQLPSELLRDWGKTPAEVLYVIREDRGDGIEIWDKTDWDDYQRERKKSAKAKGAKLAEARKPAKGSPAECLKSIAILCKGNAGRTFSAQDLINEGLRKQYDGSDLALDTVKSELRQLYKLGVLERDKDIEPYQYALNSDIRNLSPFERADIISAICSLPELTRYRIDETPENIERLRSKIKEIITTKATVLLSEAAKGILDHLDSIIAVYEEAVDSGKDEIPEAEISKLKKESFLIIFHKGLWWTLKNSWNMPDKWKAFHTILERGFYDGMFRFESLALSAEVHTDLSAQREALKCIRETVRELLVRGEDVTAEDELARELNLVVNGVRGKSSRTVFLFGGEDPLAYAEFWHDKRIFTREKAAGMAALYLESKNEILDECEKAGKVVSSIPVFYEAVRLRLEGDPAWRDFITKNFVSRDDVTAEKERLIELLNDLVAKAIDAEGLSRVMIQERSDKESIAIQFLYAVVLDETRGKAEELGISDSDLDNPRYRDILNMALLAKLNGAEDEWVHVISDGFKMLRKKDMEKRVDKIMSRKYEGWEGLRALANDLGFMDTLDYEDLLKRLITHADPWIRNKAMDLLEKLRNKKTGKNFAFLGIGPLTLKGFAALIGVLIAHEILRIGYETKFFQALINKHPRIKKVLDKIFAGSLRNIPGYFISAFRVFKIQKLLVKDGTPSFEFKRKILTNVVKDARKKIKGLCFNYSFYIKDILEEQYGITAHVKKVYIRKEGQTYVHYWVETEDGWILDAYLDGNAFTRSVKAFRRLIFGMRKWIVLAPDETELRRYYPCAVTTYSNPAGLHQHAEETHNIDIVFPPQ
ncbi:MAG: division/cell wall cluster transcriptional repressor MraZ, partial [Candidatus Omnitrophica bacterium]|nr:division/cell wall cluster transcriptional repressor MraZ [Candidatus Omnitrophota bacterium]